jgi:hypothetical protein
MAENQYQEYRRRKGTEVVAIRLDLDTDGFTYEKWGGIQTCKRGDWIVYGGGSTYTVDAASFAKTYTELRPGLYVKVGSVWAKEAGAAGSICTKEGTTDYEAGDFIVCNDSNGEDCWAVSAEDFSRLYESVK